MSEDLEQLVRQGIERQAVDYAAGLMKTFMAPGAHKPEEAMAQGLHKLALAYTQANNLIDNEFREPVSS